VRVQRGFRLLRCPADLAPALNGPCTPHVRACQIQITARFQASCAGSSGAACTDSYDACIQRKGATSSMPVASLTERTVLECDWAHVLFGHLQGIQMTSAILLDEPVLAIMVETITSLKGRCMSNGQITPLPCRLDSSRGWEREGGLDQGAEPTL
jgi:hypothetical protein